MPKADAVDNSSAGAPHLPDAALWGVRVVAVIGVALTALLVVQANRADPLPGCGSGSGCEALLAGRWAYWVSPHVSVALLGLLTWVGIAAAAWWRGFREVLLPLTMLAAGAAAWFVLVQALLVRQWCPYCLAAHGCAAVAVAATLWHGQRAAWSALGLPAVAVALLIAGQVAFPVDAEAVLDARDGGEVAAEAVPATASADAAVEPIEPPTYGHDTTPFPRLGPADAPHELLVFSDYTCGHCRTLYRYLATARQRFPDQLRLVAVPAPINRFCNPHVPFTPPVHRDACRIARMALAVWLAEPERFAEMHGYLFGFTGSTPRDPADARAFAVSLVGEEAFVAALGGEGVNEIVSAGVALNFEIGRATDPPVDNALPKLVLPDGHVFAKRPRSEDWLLNQLQARLGLGTNDRAADVPPKQTSP